MRDYGASGDSGHTIQLMPALKLYIFVPPFVSHRAAHAHVLDVHGTLDVRTQVVEYRVAIKRRDESRHVNFGKPYTLPMKFGKTL